MLGRYALGQTTEPEVPVVDNGEVPENVRVYGTVISFIVGVVGIIAFQVIMEEVKYRQTVRLRKRRERKGK